MQITKEFLANSIKAVKRQANEAFEQHLKCLGAVEVFERLLNHMNAPEPEDDNIVPSDDET